MYHLIGSKKSRSFRVLWMLEELGVPFDYSPDSPRSESVRAVNPSGKVPVLLVDGSALTDSTAIMTFLADRHGKFTHPAGSIDRARQDGLTQLINDEMDGCLWTAARHSFVLPEEHRLPQIKDSLRWEFARTTKRLASRLEGPFLMGETMTIADILLTHCLNWAETAKFPVEQSNLLDYAAKMRERPAYLRANAR